MSEDNTPGSPPCFAHELVAGQPVDAQTAHDVAIFRRAERQRLLALRRLLSHRERRRQADLIGAKLDSLSGVLDGRVVSAYWPIRSEPDLRGWMKRAHEAGARIVLPVVVETSAPLVFRSWSPDCRMVRGVWNIPVPADGAEQVPDIVLAPLVAVDDAGYRLGNGGGYFDRTLAAAEPMPDRIGVGYDFARMPTIFPMPWDIPMRAAVLADELIEYPT